MRLAGCGLGLHGLVEVPAQFVTCGYPVPVRVVAPDYP
jgi:hypothetical protein